MHPSARSTMQDLPWPSLFKLLLSVEKRFVTNTGWKVSLDLRNSRMKKCRENQLRLKHNVTTANIFNPFHIKHKASFSRHNCTSHLQITFRQLRWNGTFAIYFYPIKKGKLQYGFLTWWSFDATTEFHCSEISFFFMGIPKSNVENLCHSNQWWDSNFLRTGSLTSGLTHNRFYHYHSLQRQTMLVDPI